MAGRTGGSCAPTTEVAGATDAATAGAVAEGVTAALDGAGSAEGTGALADAAGGVGTSAAGFGSQPPKASAAAERSTAA